MTSNERSLLDETRKLLRQMRDDIFNAGAVSGRSQRAGEELIHRIDDALERCPHGYVISDTTHQCGKCGPVESSVETPVTQCVFRTGCVNDQKCVNAGYCTHGAEMAESMRNAQKSEVRHVLPTIDKPPQ